MADDSLNITITADGSAAADQLDVVVGKAAALKAAMDVAAAAGTASGAAIAEGGSVAAAAHEAAAGAAVKHAAAEEFLGGALTKVEVGTNAMARAMGALGLSTGEASERVLGLTEALDGVGKAALPLLAIGAAVLTVAAAFNFLKDGIEEASKAQATFATLSQAVANQGGNWKTAQEGVEKFLDAIEHATTYSRGEALEAMNSLVTAGTSLADSEKIVAIATDVAAASHKSLQDVVNTLKEAEAGRGRGLIQLDEKLKPLIESHAKLSTVLTKLANDMAGQAAAALDTNAGKSELLRNVLEHLGEEIGDHLLPMLNTGAELLITFAEQAEKAAPAVTSFFDSVITGADRAIGVLQGFAAAGVAALAISRDVAALASGHVASGALADIQNQLHAGKSGMLEAGHGILGDGKTQHPLADAFKAEDAEFKRERADAMAEIERIRNQALQNDMTVGADQKPKRAKKEKQGYEAGSYDFTAADMPTFDKGADDNQQKGLVASLSALTDGEENFQRNVKLATTAQQQQNAEWNLAAKQTADGKIAMSEITAVMDEQKKKLDELTANLGAQEKAATSATAAYNSFGKSLEEESARGVKPTKDQENALKNLKTAMDAANGSVTKSQGEIDKINGFLETNASKFKAASVEADTYAAKVAASDRADQDHLDRSILSLSDGLEAQIKAAKERDQKLDQQLQDEIATYGKSLAAQAAYYERRYQMAIAAGDIYSADAVALAEKIKSIDLDEYKARIDAQKQFLEQIQSTESTLVDGIIEKHQNLKQTLHDIWGDIVKDFEKNIEEMILKGSLLNGLNSSLMKFLGLGGGGAGAAGAGGSGALGAATSGASSGGLFGSLLGSDGSQSVASALPTGGGVTGLLYGSAASTSMSATAAAAATDNNDGNPYAYGNTKSDGGFSNDTSSGTSALGGGLSSALAGFGYGETLNTLLGGNTTWGAVGSGLGAGVGTIFGGPLGGAIGGALGGALGGLFGSTPTAAKDPDEFESSTGYGQDVADLQFGQSSANGTNYFPSAAIAKFVSEMNVSSGSINGGANQGMQSVNSNGTIASSGGIDAAEMWLSQNQNDTSAQLEQMGVSPAQFKQWVQLLGTSATGTGQYSHIAGDPNIGDVEVTGATSGGGTKSTYTALANALNSIITASSGSTGVVPTFSVTRAYNDPSIVTGTTATGTYTPTPTNLIGTPAAGTTTAGSNTAATGSAATDLVGRITPPGVAITINGNVVGPGGIEGISQEIAIALGRYAQGLVPGGNSATTQALSRFTGGS
jgi:hypothetical protein